VSAVVWSTYTVIFKLTEGGRRKIPVRELAAARGVSMRTIHYHLTALKAAGALHVQPIKFSPTRNAASLYTLLDLDGRDLHLMRASYCREKQLQILKTTTRAASPSAQSQRAPKTFNHPPQLRRRYEAKADKWAAIDQWRRGSKLEALRMRARARIGVDEPAARAAREAAELERIAALDPAARAAELEAARIQREELEQWQQDERARREALEAAAEQRKQELAALAAAKAAELEEWRRDQPKRDEARRVWLEMMKSGTRHK
jgi:DNA-binding transcriptional ArsR family regulator